MPVAYGFGGMNRPVNFIKSLLRQRHLFPACLLVFFISTRVIAADDDWSLRVWRSDEGLPNNNVTSLAQTDDGYLWVATTGHFARFDGVHFEEFTPRNALPTFSGPLGRVSTFLRDSKGGLWLAMAHGPIVLLKSGVPQILTNNLPDFIVQSMVEDKDGAIWITYHGNVVCRIKDGRTTRFTSQDGLPERYDCALAVDRLGHIWFAKDGQVGRYETNHFIVLNKTLGRNVRLAPASA
jgi:ligand-binding sensor domain-containing protein